MDDNRIEVKFTISKKALKIIAMAIGMIILSLLPGGFFFAATVVIITLLLNRKSQE